MTLQELGGKVGSAIDTYGKYVPFLGPISQIIGDKNISESLESWGGSAPGSSFQWVKPAYAAEGEIQGTTTSAGTSGSGFGDLLGPLPSGGTTTTNPQPTGDTNTGDGGFDYGSYLDQQYSSLFGDLDSQLTSLGSQKAGQEQIAQNSYQQVQNTLDNTYNTNTTNLESNQKKNLNSLTDYLNSAFQQGNVLLGTRGASDSSAANQYSYALAKQGSKGRGDIIQQTEQIKFNLKSAYDTETKNNDLDRQNKLLQIQQWYDDAQRQIGTIKSNLQAQKSQQILDYAMQALGQVQQTWASNKSILDQWAANKASSLGQLTQMLNQTSANMPTFQGLNSTVGGIGGGGGGGLFGFANTTDKDKSIGF